MCELIISLYNLSIRQMDGTKPGVIGTEGTVSLSLYVFCLNIWDCNALSLQSCLILFLFLSPD